MPCLVEIFTHRAELFRLIRVSVVRPCILTRSNSMRLVQFTAGDPTLKLGVLLEGGEGPVVDLSSAFSVTGTPILSMKQFLAEGESALALASQVVEGGQFRVPLYVPPPALPVPNNVHFSELTSRSRPRYLTPRRSYALA